MNLLYVSIAVGCIALVLAIVAIVVASGKKSSTGSSCTCPTGSCACPSGSCVCTGTVPSGSVVMWSGTQADVPTGWVFCDGDNGTPDLRGKFVLGVNDGLKNADGQVAMVKDDPLPLSVRAFGDNGGEETHLLTIPEIPSHGHMSNQYGLWGTGNANVYNGGSPGNNAQALGDTTSSTGGGLPHNTMPPYFALCYIMKT